MGYNLELYFDILLKKYIFEFVEVIGEFKLKRKKDEVRMYILNL